MASRVDLQQLTVDRTRPASSDVVRKRHLMTRYGLPLTVLTGFVAVAAWSAREQFLPARPVTVVPVILMHAEERQAGKPLFQAAGWVEPRPSAVMVSAMVEGVIEELFVTEGQAVEKGQPIARLYQADAQLAVAEAKATVSLREAELDQAQASLDAAKVQVEQPLQLQAAYADAEAVLAKLQTEIKNLPFAIRSAESRMVLARQSLEGKQIAAQSIALRTLQQAQSEFDSAAAELEQLQQRGPALEREAQAWQRKCDALKRQLALNPEATQKVAEGRANVKAAEAKLQQAKLVVDVATLRLSRMTVHAPISGRVMAVVAKSGRRLMGLNPASEYEAATVVTMYDPTMLQVRADVRLEDVAQVQPGQPVQITSAALATPLRGEVLVATSQADIQKNTLQVKVAIHNPPPVIKPEMLVQVVFIAPEKVGESSESKDDPLRILVPRELVETSGGGSVVWVADLTRNISRRQAVRLGTAGTDELVEVTEGLTALDKLIASGREGLQDAERIKVTGDDTRVGVSMTNGREAPSSSRITPAGSKK